MREAPDVDDGYTKVANDLLEALYRAKFHSGNAYRVILWVIRNSYGWRQTWTRPVGITTLSMEIDMSKSSVHLAIQVLIENNVLKRDDQGRLSINKRWKTWDPSVQPAERKDVQPTGKKVQPAERAFSPLESYKDKSNTDKERKKTTGRSPVQEVVEVFKFLKKIGYREVETGVQDPATLEKETTFERIEQVHYDWDKANYRIYLRSAKKLLDAFGGDLGAAKVYMTARADEWEEKKLDSWELHGMARDAHNFVAKEITKDEEADAGRALALRGGVGEGPAGSLGAPHGGRGDGGAGSRRRFTSSRELAGRALEGLQPKDD